MKTDLSREYPEDAAELSDDLSEDLSSGETFSGVVPSEADGVRIDRFLVDATGLSRSLCQKLLEEGAVRVGDAVETSKKRLVSAGETYSVLLPEPEETAVEPEDIPLDIVYEDGDLLVVNKPAGMVVHPAPGNPRGTLVNALLFHCKDSLSGIGGVRRPGIVHRIDKDTAGLLVVAKNDKTHESLSAQLKVHGVRRVYHAIAIGNFKDDAGTVETLIGRHPTDRKKMAVLRPGQGTAKQAVTHYEVVERFGRFTHVKCELETGRTHQIRVHMAHLGHPLLGDPVYGGDGVKVEKKISALLTGQCLCATELTFTHPTLGKEVSFSAPFPSDFAGILSLLRKENG